MFNFVCFSSHIPNTLICARFETYGSALCSDCKSWLCLGEFCGASELVFTNSLRIQFPSVLTFARSIYNFPNSLRLAPGRYRMSSGMFVSLLNELHNVSITFAILLSFSHHFSISFPPSPRFFDRTTANASNFLSHSSFTSTILVGFHSTLLSSQPKINFAHFAVQILNLPLNTPSPDNSHPPPNFI
jgi:hypothetical protein